jgi:hypothetical protein
MGELSKALDIYTKILEDNCMDIEIVSKKALLLKKLNRYEEAYD